MKDPDIEDLLEDAGVDKSEAKKVEMGDVLDTLVGEHDGEEVIFQGAVNNHRNSSHTLLMTGGRVLDYLNTDFVPEVIEMNYNDEYAWHLIEKVDGRHPEGDDWYDVGNVISELHEIDADFNYGSLVGTEEGLQTKLSTEKWSGFLDERFRRFKIKSIGTPLEDEAFKLDYVWSSIPEENPERSVLHNDIITGNSLVSKEETVLLDFDQAIVGDPSLEFYKAIENLKFRGIEPEPFQNGYLENRDVKTSLKDHYTAYSLMNQIYTHNSRVNAGIESGTVTTDLIKERVDEFVDNLTTSP